MIRIFVLFCLLISGGIILTSCASMTKEECAVADWKSVGERDGAAGRGLKYFARNVDACKKTNARPDQAAWQEGHAIGARRYCTPENGLLAGNNGKNYNNICPIDLQAEFLSAYQLGQQRHSLLQEHRTKASGVASNKSTISDLERKVSKGKIDKRDAAREIRNLHRDNRDLKFQADDVLEAIAVLDRRIRFEGFTPPAAPAPIY